MTAPMCDRCGEDKALIRYSTIGLCGDCAGAQLRPNLERQLGYNPCARMLQLPDCRVICLEPYGVEHDHQAGGAL